MLGDVFHPETRTDSPLMRNFSRPWPKKYVFFTFTFFMYRSSWLHGSIHGALKVDVLAGLTHLEDRLRTILGHTSVCFQLRPDDLFRQTLPGLPGLV